MTQPIIALCEDDLDLGSSLVDLLTESGYKVMLATCSEELDIQVSKTAPDALLVDYRLPGEDGRAIARRYHQLYPSLPIIMMSVEASADDQLAGFGSGAMLYLPKPFQPEALLAALGGLFRSFQQFTDTQTLRFNRRTRQLLLGGLTLQLTQREAATFQLLAIRSPEAVEYYELLEAIADESDTEIGSKANLEVIISRLRKKLREADISRELCSIASSHGHGYAMLGLVKII